MIYSWDRQLNQYLNWYLPSASITWQTVWLVCPISWRNTAVTVHCLVHEVGITSVVECWWSAQKTEDTLVPHARLVLLLVHQGATVAPTRLRRPEVVGVATATAVRERLARARNDVIVPASNGGAARTSQRRQRASTCQPVAVTPRVYNTFFVIVS